MDFIFKVDPIRRNIKVPDGFTVLTMDHNVHKLVFVCPYYEDFAFDSASIVFMVDAPDGKQYIIPAEEYESFPNSPAPYVKFTLTLKSYITSVVGYMSFCITADIISSGNVIEKSWHSKNISISIGGHIDNDDSEDIPEEDVPTINQRLNNLDSKVGRLQTTVNGMANGSPTPVATVAEMTDESAVYLYTGSETGYTAGNWYFYNGSAWTSGGTYGGAVTDTTLSISGAPADAKAVRDALAEKADADDVTALDTRVIAVEGTVETFDGRITAIEELDPITPVFEQGTISSSYKPADNANRIRTVDVFNVNDFSIAECDSGHSIWWAEYKADMTGNALHTKGTLKSVTPADFADGTVFVRFILVNSASATPITPSDAFDFSIKTSRIAKVDAVIEKVETGFADINLIDDSDWEIGGFDERGFLQAIYRMRTSSVYHVSAGDSIKFAVPSGISGSVKYEVAYYENGKLTSLSGKLSADLTFDGEYDIRIAIGLAGSYEAVNPELKRCINLYSPSYSEGIKKRTVSAEKTAGRIIQRRQNIGLPFEYRKHHTFGDSIACDFFFMGDDLWTFSASANDNSTSVSFAVRTYDPETETFTSKKTGLHNLGHANSMSYSEGNDCLICGNGSDDYTLANKFFICPNLSELTGNIDINTNCIVYDCSALNLGAKLNVIWGDANKGNYDIAYGITDDNAHIYKILLGRGTNALTYGTLISGKSDTEFNGTFAIVETYSQDVCGYETCVQGSTYYKGSIYAGIGHNVSGIRIWKMTPQRDGSIHTEEYTEPMWNQDMTATGNVGGIATWHDRFFISMGSGNVYAYDATVLSDDLADADDVTALDTRVTAVEGDIDSITEHGTTTTTYTNESEIFTTQQGYIFSDGSVKSTSSTAHGIWYFQTNNDLDVYLTDLLSDASKYRLTIYSGTPLTSAGLVKTYQNADTYPLPVSPLSPAHVEAGQYIAVSIYNQTDASKKGFSLVCITEGGEITLASDLGLTDTMTDEVEALIGTSAETAAQETVEDALSNLYANDGWYNLPASDFAQKAWSGYSSTDNRLFRVRCTKDLIFDRDVFIRTKSGYKLAGFYSDGTGISATEFVKIPANTAVHLYVRTTVEDTSAVADVATYADALLFSTPFADMERLLPTFTDISMFERVGIGGDSYAGGGGIISGIRSLTWGKNLERQAGITVDIYAKSGQDVMGWVSDTTNGLPAILAGTECGLYWLAHGINGTSTPELLGTSADMSASPRPNTFYGQYAEAIEQIKTAFPNAKIVIQTIIGSNYGLYLNHYTYVNQAIRDIAEYCQIPVIDVADDEFYLSPYYSDNIRSQHPTAMVAAGMAMANRRLLSKCILDNPAYFIDYGSN